MKKIDSDIIQNEYKIGDTILVPDPDPNYQDNWIFGNFLAIIIDIDEESGMIITEDAEGDCFGIEISRQPEII